MTEFGVGRFPRRFGTNVGDVDILMINPYRIKKKKKKKKRAKVSQSSLDRHQRERARPAGVGSGGRADGVPGPLGSSSREAKRGIALTQS